jgi:hypothetical protein
MIGASPRWRARADPHPLALGRRAAHRGHGSFWRHVTPLARRARKLHMFGVRLPLSVLDLSPVSSGSSAAAALANTLDLARLADELGFTR